MFRRQPNDHQRRNTLVSEIFVKPGSDKGAIHRFVKLFFSGQRLYFLLERIPRKPWTEWRAGLHGAVPYMNDG